MVNLAGERRGSRVSSAVRTPGRRATAGKSRDTLKTPGNRTHRVIYPPPVVSSGRPGSLVVRTPTRILRGSSQDAHHGAPETRCLDRLSDRTPTPSATRGSPAARFTRKFVLSRGPHWRLDPPIIRPNNILVTFGLAGWLAEIC